MQSPYFQNEFLDSMEEEAPQIGNQSISEVKDRNWENSKFTEITKRAYMIGFFGHLTFLIGFVFLGITEMVYFNIFFSIPAFSFCMWLNRREFYSYAFALAFLEILFHQILATYYLGWGFGAYYWLVYLVGITYLNPRWGSYPRFVFVGVVLATFVFLFLRFPQGKYELGDGITILCYLVNSMITLVLLVFLISYFSRATFNAQQELKEEQVLTSRMLKKIQSLFGQQISKEIAKEMMESDSEIASRSYIATVMFLDIRDFTVFADSRDPEEVAKFQNIVFGQIIELIQINHGVVLQLLGDGVMAVFGAPVADSKHALRAVETGFVILEKIQSLAEEGSIPPIRMGIGLNSGNVLATNIGNEDRKSYSLTGINVIIASRIEQLNKVYDSQFLISKSVLNEVLTYGFAVENLGGILLKGIERPVEVYRLV